MPIMLRVPGKATKIAYAIIGKPANMRKRTPAQRKIDKRIGFEESSDMR